MEIKEIFNVFDNGYTQRMPGCMAYWLKEMLDKGYLILDTLRIPEISIEKCQALEEIERNFNRSWIVKHGVGKSDYSYVYSVVELLHLARDIPYEQIGCEEGYVGGIADILAEKEGKYIPVELGSFPSNKYFSVLLKEVEEFWFNGERGIYVLKNPRRIPPEIRFFVFRGKYRRMNCERGDYYLINCRSSYRDSCLNEFLEEKGGVRARP